VWLGKDTSVENFTKSKKGNQWEMMSLTFHGKKEMYNIKVDLQQGEWLVSMLPRLSVNNIKVYTLQEVKENYEAAGLTNFELFWDNKPVNTLHKVGLLRL